VKTHKSTLAMGRATAWDRVPVRPESTMFQLYWRASKRWSTDLAPPIAATP
jgi:hypothetical protein